MRLVIPCFFFFFFNDTATTEIYTLSLHDALPISRESGRDLRAHSGLRRICCQGGFRRPARPFRLRQDAGGRRDRKSTRLNSSHLVISYAVFCLKKKIRRPSDYTSIRRTSPYDASC